MVEAIPVAHVLVGIAVLGAVVLPRLLADRPLSMPIVYVAGGFLLFSLPIGVLVPGPTEAPGATEILTELVVVIALTGAALKLDRPFGLWSWRATWRLLGITMPLTIAAAALLGWGVLGWFAPTAVLLGAVIAPTDPVLASDVEADPPLAEIEEQLDSEQQVGTVRFALTSESGLNDGLAFPFTNLAIAMAGAASLASASLYGEWLLVDVGYRIVVGLVGGYVVGSLFAHLIFRTPSTSRLSETMAGAEALAATLVSYGVTELVGGYGFIAVFVAALELRHFEWEAEYHRSLHDFAVMVERLLMATVLVLFGGAIASGMLAPLDWAGVAVGVVILFVVRPIAGLIGLVGFDADWLQRVVIATFGIRGIGSFFYLSHAINQGVLEGQARYVGPERLWAVVGFIVLTSIVVHGIVASPVMGIVDELRERGFVID